MIYVVLCLTLGHVVGGNSCGVSTVIGVATTRAGYQVYWSTQAKVEGVMSNTAWHWCKENSFVTNLLGNQAAPHCMQAFRLRGAPWTVTLCFSPYVCRRSHFLGLRQTYMNE
jgi:hypothetical protein